MRVAGEIGEHLRGAAEGLLGVDDPVDPPNSAETFGEGRRIGERRKFAEEAEVASCEGRRQPLEEQPPEEARERLDRQKEVRAARDPARPVGREAAARDDAMEMGMMGQRLAPGVQDGETTDPGAEAPRVRRQRRHRLGRRPEQDRIDEPLVLEGDRRDWLRQGEDDMEIGHGQEFGLARGEPSRAGGPLTLRTMPVATGVVGDPRRAAIVAGLDMAAERRGATGLDRAHHPLLDTAKTALMGAGVGGTMTV